MCSGQKQQIISCARSNKQYIYLMVFKCTLFYLFYQVMLRNREKDQCLNL